MRKISKHPREIMGYNGSIDDLIKDIGEQDYILVFVKKLSDDIKKQADGDLARGRPELAQKLYNTSNFLYEAKDEIDLSKKRFHIEGFDGTIDKLVKSSGNMQYDCVAKLIEKLADFSKGKSYASKLYQARDEMNKAWKICKPYMGD